MLFLELALRNAAPPEMLPEPTGQDLNAQTERAQAETGWRGWGMVVAKGLRLDVGPGG
jgi:hypothetical protein